MNIKVLGSGCKNCTILFGYVEEAVKELGLQANIEKVTDFKEIVAYGVMKTPGLVVNRVVKVSGRVPSREEIKEILKR